MSLYQFEQEKAELDHAKQLGAIYKAMENVLTGILPALSALGDRLSRPGLFSPEEDRTRLAMLYARLDQAIEENDDKKVANLLRTINYLEHK